MTARAIPITSFCFLILGAICLVGSFDLPLGSSDSPGPGFYPLCVGIAVVFLSAFLFIRSLKPKEPPREKEEDFPRGKDLQRVVAVSLTLISFVVFLKPLGYGICSAAMIGAILRFLGMRSLRKIILISILGTAFSYSLFVYILEVPLPRGIFFS